MSNAVLSPDADEEHKSVSPEELEALEQSFAADDSAESGSQKLAAKQPTNDDEENAAAHNIKYAKSHKGKWKAPSWLTKKRVGIAGTVAGIGVGGSLLGLTVISGPLQLITLSHYLQKSFARSNDESS